MSLSIFCRHLCLIALLMFTASAMAADKPKEKTEKKEDAKPAAESTEKEDTEPEVETKTIKKRPFRIVVELDGVFEGKDAEEITLAPEEWSRLTVVKAAAHGAHVRKGDVLLQLETKDLDEAIANLEAELKLSAVGLKLKEERLAVYKKLAPMDLELARRNTSQTKEDRDMFVKKTKPLLLELAEVRLKMSRSRLEYAQEELRQLEKMYKADDITEETEQIVLQRARDELEVAKFSVVIAEFQHDLAMKFDIPRQEQSIEEMTNRSILELDQNEALTPLMLEQEHLELGQTRERIRKAEEKLEKLTADRKLMTVRSPIEGIVYYGQVNRGRPSDSSSMESMLVPNGSVSTHQVLMTVIKPRPLLIRVSVPEENLHDVRPGLKGVATPTGYPDLRLPVEVDQVSDIPYSSGRFDGRLSVRLKGKTKFIMPGMTCEIKFVPYQKADAILVDSDMIVADELDDEKKFVEVLDKKNKPQRRRVTVGREKDGKIEIIKGLKEGDRVVVDPSNDDS